MNTRLWATWFIEIGAAIASLDSGQPHRTRTEEQRAPNLVPTIVLDYAFMSAATRTIKG